MILALALLFEPLEKFAPHIMLLGLELVLVNVRLPKEKPEDGRAQVRRRHIAQYH